MKRTLVSLIATASLVVVALPGSAAADTPLATSHAAAAKVTPGAGLAPQVTTAGALGGLLDFLTPVLDNVVTPLTTQLLSLPTTLVSDVVSGLVGAGYEANSPNTPQSPPSSGFPDCSTGTWTSATCYGPLVPTISAAPLLTLGTGTLQGYAAADATGSYSAARTAGLDLSVLGISLGDLGVASSSSQCLASGVCSSAGTLASLSLLSGVVSARTATDGSLQVSVNGSSFAPLSALTSPTTVSAAGVTATVQAQGAALRVNVALSLDQLLGALGIADVLSSLNASVLSSTITLSLTIGAGQATTTGGVSAWGLELGLGLSADIEISVVGLVQVSVVVPGDATSGNLLDLELAYTTATSAASTGLSGAPPDLV